MKKMQTLEDFPDFNESIMPLKSYIAHTCGDCGVGVGEVHYDGCDISRCPNCGMQRLSCDCSEEEKFSRDVIWTGIWPGELEAIWYNVSLNELHPGNFRWDKDNMVWVKKKGRR